MAAAAPVFTACEDVFEPSQERIVNEDMVKREPAYAQGILGMAYAILPFDSKSVSDVATDDAVTNDLGNGYLKMATGAWAADNSPVSNWTSRRAAIQYVNTFIPLIDGVEWAIDPITQKAYCDRLLGEAYAMRGLQQQYLLMYQGGKTSDGQFLGFPILLEAQDATSNFNQARNTFKECYDQIMADYDKALELLPLEYKNYPMSQIPEKYKSLGLKNEQQYNRACGEHMKGRLNGLIVRALKAQLALVAASPAFAEAGAATYADAAKLAADVLNLNPNGKGIQGMSKTGHQWYAMENKAEIENLKAGHNPAEIIWRGDISKGKDDWDMGLDQEKNNFPPSLYGNGRINPTQNLVDAFLTADGYPISEPASGYDAAKPYDNRDPRLSAYVLYNGATFKEAQINTLTGGDAMGNASEKRATRTGYYLRKLLREDCNADPNSLTEQFHFAVRIRFTEIFLAYAEAQFEATKSATAVGEAGCSAYDVIKALHDRAGVGNAYLDQIKGDEAAMRKMIRNERRLELCFENKRFWDLRRWKDEASLNQAACAMKWENGKLGSAAIEQRLYKGEQYFYGPLPKKDVTNFSALVQNMGW